MLVFPIVLVNTLTLKHVFAPLFLHGSIGHIRFIIFALGTKSWMRIATVILFSDDK